MKSTESEPTDYHGVSVVIPHYGDPALAQALVEQLKTQRTSHPIEIIVADDCSPTPFPATDGVIVARRETNGGFGANVNHGAQRASHDLLLILNSDLSVTDTFIDDLIEQALPLMPAVVGPVLLNPDGTAAFSGRRFPTITHQSVEWLTPLARFRDTDWWHRGIGHDLAAVPGRVVEVDWVVGAALLLPTASFRELAGFDERFQMNSEEVDLQRRLRDRGVKACYLGTVSCTHVGGGSTSSDRGRQWVVTSRLRYAEKWGGKRAKLALRGSLGALTVANLAVNTARRATGAPVRPWQTARREWRLLRPD